MLRDSGDAAQRKLNNDAERSWPATRKAHTKPFAHALARHDPNRVSADVAAPLDSLRHKDLSDRKSD